MSPIVKAAADRAAQLRRELAQLEGVSTLAAQAEQVRNVSRVLQINNTTIAMGDGASFDTHITDPDLVTRVRELIASDRESKAEALMKPVTLIGPDSPMLFATPAPDAAYTAAEIEDANRVTSVENATLAGREHRERNGERKNPFKADHPLGIAWLAGYDAGTPPTAPATPPPPAAAAKPAGPARTGGPVRPAVVAKPAPAAKSDPSPTDVW